MTAGENDPDNVQILHNLVDVYTSNHNYVKAEPLLLRILEIQLGMLGNKHLNVAQTNKEIGMLYTDMGNYAKAEEVL